MKDIFNKLKKIENINGDYPINIMEISFFNTLPRVCENFKYLT